MEYNVDYLHSGYWGELVGFGVSVDGVRIFDSTKLNIPFSDVLTAIDDNKKMVANFDVTKFSSGEDAKKNIDEMIAEVYGQTPTTLEDTLKKYYSQLSEKENLAMDYDDACLLLRNTREGAGEKIAEVIEGQVKEKTWYGKTVIRKPNIFEIAEAAHSYGGIMNPEIRQDVVDCLRSNAKTRYAKSEKYEELEKNTNNERLQLLKQASNELGVPMLNNIKAELLRCELQGKYFAKTGDVSVFATQKEAKEMEGQGFYNFIDSHESHMSTGNDYETFYLKRRKETALSRRTITHKEMALAMSAIMQESKEGKNGNADFSDSANKKLSTLDRFIKNDKLKRIPQSVKSMLVNVMYEHRDEFWHSEQFAELAKTLQPKTGLEDKNIADIYHKTEVLISGYEDVSANKEAVKARLSTRADEIEDGKVLSGVVRADDIAKKEEFKKTADFLKSLRGCGQAGKKIARYQQDELHKEVEKQKIEENKNRLPTQVQRVIRDKYRNSK